MEGDAISDNASINKNHLAPKFFISLLGFSDPLEKNCSSAVAQCHRATISHKIAHAAK